MTCNETMTWIDAFLDNELELSRQLEVEQHLTGCSACDQQLKDRRRLQARLHDPSLRFQLPADVESKLRESLRQATTPPSPERARPSASGWWGGFVTAAALSSALFLAAP